MQEPDAGVFSEEAGKGVKKAETENEKQQITLNRKDAKDAKRFSFFVDWVYNQQNIPCLTAALLFANVFGLP